MAGFLVMQSKAFYVEEDLEALLTRMRQRLYPETLPVLASYWLKTVSASGYGRRQWKELTGLLKRALSDQLLDGPSRQAIVYKPGHDGCSTTLPNRPSYETFAAGRERAAALPGG